MVVTDQLSLENKVENYKDEFSELILSPGIK